MIFRAAKFRNPSTILIANAASQSILRFFSNVMLARLLMPTAFALTSITMLIITGIQMVSDVGIAIMTLRHGSMNDADHERMWTMQLCRGIILSFVLVALAEPASAVYQSPDLAIVLIVLSIVPTIQGAQNLYPILALSRQDLMPMFWVEVVGRAGGTALSIAIAVIYPTVWALVIGILSQVILSTLISHLLSEKRWPRFIFDLGFIRSHWKFSRWIQLGSTMTFIAAQVDKAVFPLLYGVARFGVYGIGASFALIPAQITQRWSASIFYPLMVRSIKGSEDAKARLKSVRVTMLLYSAIVVTAVIAVSPFFFFLLYRPIYQEGARFSMLLAAACYFEVAESSLRHYPLVDKTARYEFIAVIVRLAVFASLVIGILLLKKNADLYAVSFTIGQVASFLFMLVTCKRDQYIDGKIDFILFIFMSMTIVLSYSFPIVPKSTVDAIAMLGVIGSITAGLIFFVFIKRGLPSGHIQKPLDNVRVI